MTKFGWKFEHLFKLRTAIFVFENKTKFSIEKNDQKTPSD